MSIIAVLNAQLESLTNGERQIASFVLSDPQRAIRLSSSDLAEQTGRSQSGVVKFCQKLGFRGYQDFKLAVSQATAQGWSLPPGIVHGSIEASDGFASTVQKLLGSKLHAMHETMSLNGEQTIERALDAILHAARIQLVGVGASSLVARDFAYKLQKLNSTVLYEADSHIQIANAATLAAQDTVIALSYSGTSLETIRIAERAKAAGARLISISRMQPNRLASIADIKLYVTSDEEKARSSAITSRDAQLMLLDLLFILLVQRKPEAGDQILAAQHAAAELKA
ncbi:MAG: MurR/RpiR family transcriptional regulator [Pseudomonadota bacterium]